LAVSEGTDKDLIEFIASFNVDGTSLTSSGIRLPKGA
jgi:hypothetical protein